MHLKSSTMVGDNFENYLEVTKMLLISSTVVGENFENYLPEMSENKETIWKHKFKASKEVV